MKNLKNLLLMFMVTTIIFSCGPQDKTIAADVNKTLQTTPGVSAEVKDGIVTLTGECRDETDKTSIEATVKTIKGVKTVINNCTIAPPPLPVPAPVVISGDDALSKSLVDAVKDNPTVKANVKDGEVTLTGEIKRTDLPMLMQKINALKPKKVVNQLTIK